MRMQTPRIQVSLNGPKELSIGAPQTYSVLVRNDDRISLGGLILRLDIPPGVVAQAQPASHGKGEVEKAQDGTTMLTWSFENLEGGAEATLPLRVIAEAPRNFAVAMEWTLLPLAASAGIDVLTPQLELALEGPNEVNFSEPNVFRLHIRNRGNAEANDVAVKLAAEHFGSSATQIGRIGAGEQQTVDVELVFNEPGNIIIAAEASAAGNVAAASQVGVRVRQSILEATLEAPERAYHSTEVPYILTIKNVGDAIAKNAKAVISLPVDCSVSSLPPQATLQNGSIVWDVSQIRPGQLSEIQFALTFAREGDNRVSVHCTASSAAPVECTAITSIKAVTDLKLSVIDPVAPAPVNGEVEYELKLVNRGSKAAEQVTVVALFSKDIEPTRAEGHRSQIVTGQVRFQPITRIEPGQTVTLRVFAQAATAGMHRFRAEVRTTEADVKLVHEQSTEYMESIRRTASSPSSLMR
jgi:archaellum component FlaG (FlaF/FlaG flagellin family)